ncbi:aminotransferase class III-fold pyridoxal phosphate-dependent enzyme [Lignipirellula cremea]|uniref:3-aminobutyryl-CoA aminotransferase n=1 Tax=Lignipirellula cremea TaxID=2528010 RepID=A0A518DUS8_9BACT|nr:aminotransferase class III-fold pyridoxal phosphate-dependent enzyme [Lignipirellula cremea]QDU95591.1 3-aminobutyryl-CoA aminotransferase [Lignipirellula cremea]
MEKKPAAGLRDFADPGRWKFTPEDRTLFEAQLADFVPPDAFDAHAHWYDVQHLLPDDRAVPPTPVGFQVMQDRMRLWMGERVHDNGLYFGYPTRGLDCTAANAYVEAELRQRPGSRGLMLIRPSDDSAAVEAALVAGGFAGFKVYHLFALREDSFHAEQGEFLPEWAWEMAHQRGLWITMHMVLPQALSDVRNLDYIRQHCRAWPHANLVLAHAGRGFNANHTVAAIDQLRGIENVFFDTSAVCEPAAFEAIMRAFGTTRLMYGSDFPVSELNGKAISVGDGFMWLYRQNVDWESWPHGRPHLVGIESLLALQQACRTLGWKDRDLERLFGGNARELLGIRPAIGDESDERPLVQRQYEEAKTRIPGGVQLLSKRPEMFAPGQWPAYYEQAIGCEVIDTSGRRYVDLSHNGILSCLLGFADPDVNAAVIRRVHLGSMATQQTYDEVRLAELLTEVHPWAGMARFTRTGGEAAAVAVRIARSSTGRDKIAFCGYHGWHDWYLAANLADPDALAGHLLAGLSPRGVPAGLAGSALPFHYNRLDELDQILADHGDQLAAVIMEPTRFVDPEPGFLEGVRERVTQSGARLIFDEITVGWRLCLGGAHLLYGVTPDLAIFAKAMSNGFAMGAVIGTAETMQAAEGSFISSTYWTEGVGPAAAVATIEKMRRVNPPPHLAPIGELYRQGWTQLGERHGLPATVQGRPQMVLVGFDHPESSALMTLFTTRMLDAGFLAAGAFHPTLAHQPHHVERALAAADGVFAELRQALDQGDLLQRIGHRPRHTGFARLTD